MFDMVAELGLDAEYSGHFTGLAVEAKTDTVYVASMGEDSPTTASPPAQPNPALHLEGRLTAHHSLQLGPDGWIIDRSTRCKIQF